MFLMQRYKKSMTLAIKSLSLFELIHDYPYLNAITVFKVFGCKIIDVLCHKPMFFGTSTESFVYRGRYVYRLATAGDAH